MTDRYDRGQVLERELGEARKSVRELESEAVTVTSERESREEAEQRAEAAVAAAKAAAAERAAAEERARAAETALQSMQEVRGTRVTPAGGSHHLNGSRCPLKGHLAVSIPGLTAIF